MKKSKIKELSDQTIPELQKQLVHLRADMARITLEKNAGRLKDVSLLGKRKAEVARILTFITKKELKHI